MFRITALHLFKRTQARVSAFFCVSRYPAFGGVASALCAIILFSATNTCARTADDAKPKIHLKGVSVERLDLEKAAAETRLKIQIDNPGPELKLKDLTYRLKLNDKQSAEGEYSSDITLPARASATLELPCTIDISSLPGVAWGIIAGGFDLRYDLETEFSVLLLPQFSPRLKTSIGGELSLARTVSGWTARLKEQISSKQ